MHKMPLFLPGKRLAFNKLRLKYIADFDVPAFPRNCNDKHIIKNSYTFNQYRNIEKQWIL